MSESQVYLVRSDKSTDNGAEGLGDETSGLVVGPRDRVGFRSGDLVH